LRFSKLDHCRLTYRLRQGSSPAELHQATMQINQHPFALQQMASVKHLAPGVGEPIGVGGDLVEVDPLNPD